MLNGNMLLGTFRNSLMVRLSKDEHEAALKLPGAREMSMNGRVMLGFILVDADALEADSDLNGWIGRALAYNATLPPKALQPASPRRARPGTARGKAPSTRRRG